jgi:hypothetical protein
VIERGYSRRSAAAGAAMFVLKSARCRLLCSAALESTDKELRRKVKRAAEEAAVQEEKKRE